jgi:hypothetical protein
MDENIQQFNYLRQLNSTSWEFYVNSYALKKAKKYVTGISVVNTLGLIGLAHTNRVAYFTCVWFMFLNIQLCNVINNKLEEGSVKSYKLHKDVEGYKKLCKTNLTIEKVNEFQDLKRNLYYNFFDSAPIFIYNKTIDEIGSEIVRFQPT